MFVPTRTPSIVFGGTTILFIFYASWIFLKHRGSSIAVALISFFLFFPAIYCLVYSWTNLRPATWRRWLTCSPRPLQCVGNWSMASLLNASLTCWHRLCSASPLLCEGLWTAPPTNVFYPLMFLALSKLTIFLRFSSYDLFFFLINY